MRTVVLLIALLFLTLLKKANSQTPNLIKAWEKAYGGQNLEKTVSGGQKIFMTSNNNFFIVVDASKSSDSGNKTDNNCNSNSDIWIIKIDGDGNKIFDKTLGGDSTEGAMGAFINSKNELVICGNSRSDSSCEKSQNSYGGTVDAWIVVVDSNGNYQWDKRYGWMGTEVANSIINESGTNYLIAGYDHIPAAVLGGDVTDSTNGFNDFWIIKTDSMGIKKWDHTYGGSIDENPNFALVGNNSYFFGGITSSPLANGDISTPTFGYPALGGPIDGWLIKTDTAGNKIWDKRYGGTNQDGLSFGDLLNDGNIIMTGWIKSDTGAGNISDTIGRGGIDIWLLKIDTANGNIINDKRYGGNRNDSPCSLVKTPDGGFLICARSNSDIGFEKSESNRDTSSFHWSDWWLIKVDSNLNKVWDKTLGGSKEEWCPSVVFIDDSTFIVAGTSGSDISGDKTLPTFDTAVVNEHGDVWVMKFIISTATGIEETIAQNNFTVFPNPVLSALHIELPYTALAWKHVNAVITDVAGRTVYSKDFDTSKQTQIVADVSSLSKGIYFIRIGNVVKKFVKM